MEAPWDGSVIEYRFRAITDGRAGGNKIKPKVIGKEVLIVFDGPGNPRSEDQRILKEEIVFAKRRDGARKGCTKAPT